MDSMVSVVGLHRNTAQVVNLGSIPDIGVRFYLIDPK